MKWRFNGYTNLMSVTRCYLCDQDPLTKRRFGNGGHADGKNCPICALPTCRYHLTTVRWKWKETGLADEDIVCKECKRSYEHRNWDTYNREWIT